MGHTDTGGSRCAANKHAITDNGPRCIQAAAGPYFGFAK